MFVESMVYTSQGFFLSLQNSIAFVELTSDLHEGGTMGRKKVDHCVCGARPALFVELEEFACVVSYGSQG